MRKLYSVAILFEIAILVFQWASGEILGEPPVSGRAMRQRTAHTLNLLLTVFLLLLVVPFIFPLTCQIVIKLFLWPVDLIFFSGKCSFSLAYPET